MAVAAEEISPVLMRDAREKDPAARPVVASSFARVTKRTKVASATPTNRPASSAQRIGESQAMATAKRSNRSGIPRSLQSWPISALV